MFNYSFNIAETLAVAVILLLIGRIIKKKIIILDKFFIPAPVIGGLIFSIILLIGHNTNSFQFTFDEVLKNLLMVAFFTTIGFSASFKLLRKGGIAVIFFLITAGFLVVIQNSIGMLLAKLFNLHPYIGLAAGSISLTGGHATSTALGELLEKHGAKSAFSVAIACATYGLIAGCIIGGPVAKKLLNKYKLKPTNYDEDDTKEMIAVENELPMTEISIFDAVIIIILAMGIGSVIHHFTSKYHIPLPVYIGPMLIAAIIRNICDFKKIVLPMKELSTLGNISLSLFLSIALMTMKLWELSRLALPLFIILLIQTIIMALYAYFITFNAMGRDYDAAVLAAGHCGFGLGATPNAMANMNTFTSINGPSPKAFLVLPLVGALFIDFINTSLVSMFMLFVK